MALADIRGLLETLSDTIAGLNDSKSDIRAAINERGVYASQTLPFSRYADKIRQITGGGEDGGGNNGNGGNITGEDTASVTYPSLFAVRAATDDDGGDNGGGDNGDGDNGAKTSGISNIMDFSESKSKSDSESDSESDPNLDPDSESESDSDPDPNPESSRIVSPTDDIGFVFDIDGEAFYINQFTRELWTYNPIWIRIDENGASLSNAIVANEGKLYSANNTADGASGGMIGDTSGGMGEGTGGGTGGGSGSNTDGISDNGAIYVINPVMPDVGFEYGEIEEVRIVL